MKKKNIGKRLIGLFVSMVAFVGAMGMIDNKMVHAEETVNKTGAFSTSWSTRFTAPIDYLEHSTRVTTTGKGVSIEMDVIASDLKSEANVSYIKNYWPSPIKENDLQSYLFSTAGVSSTLNQSSSLLT